MFNSNSHKDLLNCINKVSRDSSENIKTANYVREVCIKNSLNYDKAVEEIVKAIENAGDIKNIHGFVKAVVNRLNPNKFGNAIVTYIPNTQPFINDLREKKIVVLADDSVWLSEVWKYIINNLPIDINECIALNHKIIAYMIKHNERTFEDYKSKKQNLECSVFYPSALINVNMLFPLCL